jgi:hypothetical protein
MCLKMNGMPSQGMVPGPMGAQNMEGRFPEVSRRCIMAHNNIGGDNRHALQDYQMQLMLLEQQNKKRLMQANRDRDSITANAGTPGGQFAPSMSPSGSRGAGPSPTPGDPMRRAVANTPKIPQQGLPGSPMADMQNRASPAPGLDPNGAPLQPGGMPQQYYQNMGSANAMAARAPSSHPQFTMMPNMNQPSMEQIQRIANSRQWPPGMTGNQQNAAMRNAQQGTGVMGPPPTPANEQPSAQQRTQPSSPAQPAAPPTPSQSNKGAPKGKKEAASKKVSC